MEDYARFAVVSKIQLKTGIPKPNPSSEESAALLLFAKKRLIISEFKSL